MTEQAQAILTTALRLSVDERAELATELLASLDGEPDEDVTEIEHRARRVLRRGPKGRTWEELRAELRSRS